ncbi:hypothetical protein ID866_10551, partial [Astraeus odoratus]
RTSDPSMYDSESIIFEGSSMASLQQLAKQIAVAAASVNATIIPNVTSRPADAPVGPLGSLFTILSLLTSTSALRDCALLLLTGTLFEIARRNLYSLWFSFVDAFFITAEFDANDTTFSVQELLLKDAEDFFANKLWYQELGIPFRRGYLLYGAPGSGKTSVIHSIAGELGLDIYILSLSRAGLDDSSLVTLLSDLPEKCIVLMEDVDAAFQHGLNREAEEPPATSQNESESRNGPYNSSGKLSLSGILNAIDGVSANEGRILFATTNKYSVLDPALCRPGRMDIHIEFHSASKYQARELFKRFFSVASVSTTVTTEKGAEGKCESGGHVPDLIDLKTSEKSGDSSLSICGVSHWTRATELSTGQLATLADQFAAAVPERQLSMAALQGYL